MDKLVLIMNVGEDFMGCGYSSATAAAQKVNNEMKTKFVIIHTLNLSTFL